jgi:hypothetical protein
LVRRSSDPPVSPRRGGKRLLSSRRRSRKAVIDRWQSTPVATTTKGGDNAPSLPVQRKVDVAPKPPRHENATRPIRRSSICKSRDLCCQADAKRSPLRAINA